MNCEAQSLYPHRPWLEEEQFTTCFNDCHALMVAARVGKDGYVRQIAGYKTSEDDTHVQDTYHGRYSKFCGAQLCTETPMERSPSLEDDCPRVVYVFIMSD